MRMSRSVVDVCTGSAMLVHPSHCSGNVARKRAFRLCCSLNDVFSHCHPHMLRIRDCGHDAYLRAYRLVDVAACGGIVRRR